MSSKYRLGPSHQVPKDLPDGWETKQLGQLVQVVQGGRLGLTKEKDYVSWGVPAFSAAGQDGFVEPAEFRNQPGVVLSAIGANCGRCFYAAGDWTTLANVQALLPTAEFNARLLYYRTNIENYWERSGSAQPFIKPSSVKKAWIAYPSDASAQQRIAEILSTVDEAIEQTEALIAKTQQIKAGLLHDLFTRGVNADGQLRPPREEAPQLYKESPLGWIPKEWDYATLNDLVSPSRPIVYGILMPGQGHPGGIPVIKVKDVIGGEVRADNLLLTSPQIDANYQRSKVRPRDILLTIRGTVGRLAQVPPFLDGANITQDTARIAIAEGLPEFYRYYLESPSPRRHFDINTIGQAVQGINLRDVRTTPVPVVPDDEQLKIAERVASVVSSERTEREHQAKLTQAKQGLMQDMLTGRVPATVEYATEPMDVAANV